MTYLLPLLLLRACTSHPLGSGVVEVYVSNTSYANGPPTEPFGEVASAAWLE